MDTTLDALQKLVTMLGAPTAIALVGWWWERRTNAELQRRLLKLAAAQLHLAGETKAALETIKEIVRHE